MPLAPLLLSADGPAFREPWQAKAFAMVVLLNRQGLVAWEEWVRVLSEEIAAAPQRPGEEIGRAHV